MSSSSPASSLPASSFSAPRLARGQTASRVGTSGRLGRLQAPALGAAALAVLLGTLAVGIVLSQRQSRSQILSTFALRGTSSATFVSTFIAQQAERERDAAERFLSEPRVSPRRFRLVVAAFGSDAAVLLDSGGRALDVFPPDPPLLGRRIAGRYAHLSAAERGGVAVSDVVPSAVRRVPVAAVAVPFPTAAGRRVFSAAYGVSSSTLGAFVAHAIPYRQHEVFLLDSNEQLLAASPKTAADSLGEADPALAHALNHSSLGPVEGSRTPSTFTAARVPGTSWRLVIAVPDSRLYESIGGWTRLIPWLVFALVSVLGVTLVVLFARLNALSRRMTESARTDSLTGLANRRAVAEHLARSAALARRRGQPMSVLMVDLDRFKETNDRHGHRAGDRVLRAVADCMRNVLRAEDVPGRWGGDEFIVVMPAADEDDARTVVARLQAAAIRVDLSDIGLAGGVQMSVGTATAILAGPDEMVHAADLALYEDKMNRASASASSPPPVASATR